MASTRLQSEQASVKLHYDSWGKECVHERMPSTVTSGDERSNGSNGNGRIANGRANCALEDRLRPFARSRKKDPENAGGVPAW